MNEGVNPFQRRKQIIKILESDDDSEGCSNVNSLKDLKRSPAQT